ncbi:MAG: DUF971 domain-containing protein [Tepidisphaeraceae bacterium]|jgi:DUF971 family protein
MAEPSPTPAKLDLKRDEKLEILWKDGQRSVYKLDYLRSMCPCATCKEQRFQQEQSKSLLKILPGNYDKPLTVVKAEMVGNYALRIDWSDDHSTGIYSFEYLRSISPPAED